MAGRPSLPMLTQVLCPYNYLLDPSVRDASRINLDGAVVIFDEAHNIEDMSREAARCAGWCCRHAAWYWCWLLVALMP